MHSVYRPSKKVKYHEKILMVQGNEKDKYYDNLSQFTDLSKDPVAEFASKQFSEDAVIFDVGCNIGLLSLAFSNIVSSGSVHSFEPSPKTYEYAKANFRSNHCENVHLNQFAITNKDMALDFYDTQEFSAGSFVGSSGELASHNHIE